MMTLKEAVKAAEDMMVLQGTSSTTYHVNAWVLQRLLVGARVLLKRQEKQAKGRLTPFAKKKTNARD